VSGKWRAILDPLSTLISLLARQVRQHREARAAFDESADRRAVQAQDEITFPVPRPSAPEPPGLRPPAVAR
jgi:hypothetical protein